MAKKITDRNRKLVAQSKRLMSVEDGLREMEEGADLAIGQLTYLTPQERLAYSDVEECIKNDIAFLRSALHSLQSNILRQLADDSDKAAYDLEKPLVIQEAEDILENRGVSQ